MLSFIRLDAGDLRPKVRQIQDQIRTAILHGHLRPGTRLPASRVLADELSVSRATVVHVLEKLKNEGYLEARAGSGTYVCERLDVSAQRFSPPPPAGADDTTGEAPPPHLSRMGAMADGVSVELAKADYRPFLPNHPALERFPFAVWRKCCAGALRGGRVASLAYGDLAGEPVLRQRIAEYLALHRGDPCDPEQIVITTGSHAAFTLAVLALAAAGDRVWFEDPGPVTVHNLLRVLDLEVCPVGIDAAGMDVAGAAERHGDARLVFTMPARHHPLGITMAPERRLALLEWAHSNEAWIIEDDYDSEFRYDGAPLPSMRSTDRHNRVIHVGTFSKALYPAIRVGYLVLPPALVGVFRNLAGLVQRGVATEVQLGLAEFIGGGHFASHLRRMRELYAERRAAFLAAGREELAGLARIDCPQSGMNALIWLEGGRDDAAIHRAALAAGVRCLPLADYVVRRPQEGEIREGALILGFAGVPAEKMQHHLARLAAVIRQGGGPQVR